ncbi:nucleobase:cation symporter-2 family protein [Amycolatopsis cynarae]|uniref:Nucleobase:cation symporter-2 family protein n=1 Tax=Amycolatopsis cynarae TaxID=2995223 RepID=A0ABY7B8C9_9PSEU|nr:nucleobase:cation symporter-2 family protein [Amycolatopsis sp. HUAS 11-8]WAL68612.1 nucleobase:cation symporter-2 family protein [Amycolatopsis sp. HUAS 11-8]
MPTRPAGSTLSAARTVLLGLQHMLIMYTGCVTVPLVFGAAAGLDERTVGLLVNADLLVAGIVTAVQSLGLKKVLGLRMPVVTGATFSALTSMILIQGQYGVRAVYGAMLAAGVFGLLVAVPFSRLIRFFPPLVTGVVITVVGLSLIGTAGGMIVGQDPAAADYASVRRLALAAAVIAIIVLLARVGRGFVGRIGVLIALVAGTALAVPFGFVDFSGLAAAPWFGLTSPFLFGAPRFPVAAVVSMCIVMLVIFTESTASIMAVGEATGDPVDSPRLARGLATDGFSGLLGGVFNAFLDTVYAQNVGLIGMTRVSSRYVTAVTGAILVVLGLVPKIGGLVAALPGPVIGAASLVLFAMVAMVGISTLRRAELDRGHNLTIAATALGVGLLPVFVPHFYHAFPTAVQVIAGSGITDAAVVAFALNLLFNHTCRKPAAEDTESGADGAGAGN